MNSRFLVCALLLLPACREKNPGHPEAPSGQLTKPETTLTSETPQDDENQPAASGSDSSEDLIRFLASKPSSEERRKALTTLQAEFELFAKDHPDRTAAFREFVLKYIADAEPGPERDGHIYFLLPTAGTDGYREKLAVVLEFYSDPFRKGSAIATLFARAAKIDPAWAYEAAANLEEPRYRDSAYWSATGEVCRNCASFPEAIELVAQFTDGAIPHRAMVAIADKDWQDKIPANLGQVLDDLFTAVECSEESKNYLIDALVKPMSKHGTAATVSLLKQFDVTTPSAWEAAAQHVPDVTPASARLFLANLPDEAGDTTTSLLHRLMEMHGEDSMWQVLSEQPEERQKESACWMVLAHSAQTGLPLAIQEARTALSSDAYLETLRFLAASARPIKLSQEDLQLVQAAIAEVGE